MCATQFPAITGRRRSDPTATIGVLAYRGVSSREIDEPVTALSDRMIADVVLIGPVAGRVHAVEPSREVDVEYTPTTAPPIDVLVVPGGLGWKQLVDDEALRRWLDEAAGHARGILAMSTGSLLLASVGRLDGRTATGHWLAHEELAALGATVTTSRTATDEAGRVVTASGALAAMAVIDEFADCARWADQPR